MVWKMLIGKNGSHSIDSLRRITTGSPSFQINKYASLFAVSVNVIVVIVYIIFLI